MIYVIRQWEHGNIAGIVECLTRNQIPYRLIEAWDDPVYPRLTHADGLIALGGPASACRFDHADYPHGFLRRESRYLWQARALGIPVLGICLGHQLLGAMRGSEVSTGELVFGVHAVETTLQGRGHWLYAGLPSRLHVYQNHRDGVRSVPNGAVVLATSETCAIEAVEWDDSTVSVQFHPEVFRKVLPEIIQKNAECMGGVEEISRMVHRLPLDDTVGQRFFDNFFYRAGCIARPSWCEDGWSAEESASSAA